jgi:hypothetical protein
VGELNIRVNEDSQYCFTVFCRFEDVERAKQKFNCNPYSGKYNLHQSTEGLTVDEAVEYVVIHLKDTLPNN